MGASSSKIEEDKALSLCCERKRFVKQALDGRCLLAAAHSSYVQSLKNTGAALRRFADPQALDETSLNSHLPNTPPPFSHHVEGTASLFLASSLPPSARFHANHMAAARIPSITIEELPPAQLVATVQTMSPSKMSELHSNENTFHLNNMKTEMVNSATFEDRPLTSARATVENSSPEAPPWDYFGLFHPLDRQFSIEEGKMPVHGLDNDDIRHLREDEGIPELEEVSEQTFPHKKDDSSVVSEDDFDQESDKPLVQTFKNRNDEVDSPLTNTSESGENSGPKIGLHQNEENIKVKPQKNSSGTTTHRVDEKEQPTEDLFLCIKEIEVLFFKASDYGGEVPRMLEASKLQLGSLLTEEIVHKWKASTFLAACFKCCKEDVHISQAPVLNELKYLPWHGSMLSRSSSSRIPFSSAPNDAEASSSNLFDTACMNSGSHASTLNRLFAWEKKLYDEVKASGVIRREYDMKCKLLRLQDSRAESAYKVDKTRAAVKDLHSRIRVAIHRIESISKSIEELRDKELQPQLEELIGGFTRMWTMMLECHNNQCRMIPDSSNKNSLKAPAPSESHRQATILLQFELSSLLSSFTKWIAAHKFYLKSMNSWLLKCVLMAPVPKHKTSRRRASQFSPRTDIAPPIFITCRDWISLMDDLPSKQVEDAISDLIQILALFLPHPEKGNSISFSSFYFSWRVKYNEQYTEIVRNELPIDRSLDYGILHSGLVVFLDSLRVFAMSSLGNYHALQNVIDDARARYEKSDIRR